MICRNCGAANPPDAAACRVCGRPPGDNPALETAPQERVPAPRILRQPPPAPPRPASPPTSTLAIASLVGGIASWVVAPVIATIVAIACGHLALREIDASAGTIQGRGLATAGLILGYAQVAIIALAILGFCVFAAVSVVLFQMAGVAG
ncbi:MAG: DUF4190 domain-containing protein [Dehalococcoidia bacterium]